MVQADNCEDMGRKNLTLSNSLPPGLSAQNGAINNSQEKDLKMDHCVDFNRTYHQNNVYQQQHQQQVFDGSRRHSPADLSPLGGYADSPTSASFTSAQSELDDVILDEILSMEEEQKLRLKQQTPNGVLGKHFVNSFSYTDNLQILLNNNTDNYSDYRRVPYNRQISNSAPTSTVDIEGLVKDECYREQEVMRDRRKKDVHNMIERRRRYNINDRIKELGTLLPKTCTEEMKMNKGSILKASVDYIRVLRKDHERISDIQQKQHVLEVENKKMLHRIQELELQLKTHGVPVPGGGNTSSTTGSVSLEKLIKLEPVEDNEPPTPQAGLPHQMQNPLSTYHAQNNLKAHIAHCQYNPTLCGHSYAISTSANNLEMSYYSTYSTAPEDIFAYIDANNEHHGQFKEQYGSSRDHFPEMILDMGCENLNTPGLMSSVDPMISAVANTRLACSQVPSPDVHWDASNFSPETSDKMDFVS